MRPKASGPLINAPRRVAKHLLSVQNGLSTGNTLIYGPRSFAGRDPQNKNAEELP
jgi:hypothetical protein